MSDDEGVTHTRDVVVDEHWRPGATHPERDLRETIDAVTIESSPNADDIESDDEPVMRSSPDWAELATGRERCEGCGVVGVPVTMTGKWYDLQPGPDDLVDWYPHTPERCRALRATADRR